MAIAIITRHQDLKRLRKTFLKLCIDKEAKKRQRRSLFVFFRQRRSLFVFFPAKAFTTSGKGVHFSHFFSGKGVHYFRQRRSLFIFQKPKTSFIIMKSLIKKLA
ncbi:hypothetical protein PCS78_25985 (plasmid) [Escherichia coli]|nr:hypothetical protein [Escherichia coli]WMO56037.1 hypothetical protein PCS78_25985 [Escherichia coli]